MNSFDWQYYLNKYPDLRINGVHTEQQSKQHWITHGEKEGRVSIKTPPLFDWQYYLDKYPDLRINGVHTEQQAIQHWITYGEKEGRVACNIINNDFINEDNIVNWIKLNGGVLHTRKISNINDINLSLCPENTIVGLTGYDRIIEKFFSEQINLFKNKIILVTLETDRFYMKEEYVNNPLISHWFTWNKPYNHTKVTCIPIGLNYDRQQVSLSNYLKSKSSSIQEERKLLCSNFSLNVNERGNLINKVTNDWKDFCDVIPNIPFIQTYVIPSYTDGHIAVDVTNPLCYEVLSKYKFILSPRGGGVDCHRTWEALYLDIIPIVLSSSINELYEELPVLVINDWNEITEEFLNEKYIEILTKKERGEYNMEKLNLFYWIKKIYKIYPIHFITYGNSVFERAKKRLINQAKEFYPFKSIKGYGPDDLPEDFKEKFKNILNMERIGGYGIWRPIIIKEKLNEINDNEFLIYLDAGCNLNPKGMSRFNEYIDLLDKSEFGAISFQMTGNKGPGTFEKERRWTTTEIFNYFKVDLNSDIGNSGQYLDGILILKKNKHLMNLIELWSKAVYDNSLMFTDYYNNINQHSEFQDNRHEQSVFSIIQKLHGSVVIDGDETWMEPFGEGESLKYPFWATRSRV